ncbi:MAG: hypothetical protein PHE78_02210 [Candidatus Gastranaerophilales bacterium]|nr:hypothetical protein [Candidatus Gastranaerophilales bacterium]
MGPGLNFLDYTVGKKLPASSVSDVQQLGALSENMEASKALSGSTNVVAGDVANLSSGVQVDFDAEGNEIRTQTNPETGEVTKTVNKKDGISKTTLLGADGKVKTEEASYKGVLENKAEYYPDGKTLKNQERYENGQLVEKTEFQSDGSIATSQQYKNGKLSYEEDHTQTEANYLNNNKPEKITTQKWYGDDGKPTSVAKTYNETYQNQGRLGVLATKQDYSPDDSSKKTVYVRAMNPNYNGAGLSSVVTNYEENYDRNGQLILPK